MSHELCHCGKLPTHCECRVDRRALCPTCDPGYIWQDIYTIPETRGVAWVVRDGQLVDPLASDTAPPVERPDWPTGQEQLRALLDEAFASGFSQGWADGAVAGAEGERERVEWWVRQTCDTCGDEDCDAYDLQGYPACLQWRIR
jgi:hypothetical protein